MTKTLYPLVAGAVPTHILNDFTFGDAARIVVENVEDIPNAPNIVTIKDNSDAFITVEYSTFTGNILSGLVFVSGDINHVFLAGSYVSRCYTTYDHEALVEFIETKETSVPGSSLVPDVKVVSYDAHLIDTENPHAVTKAQVGLGNVDNTSDTTKADTEGNPVHDKIETKAPISHADVATTYGVASATNYGHPKATSATPSNATLEAAVGTDDGLYARGDHSHAKETFTMNGVTINSGDWVSDSTYRDYPYKATISNSSISASHIPIVILSNDDAITGNICTVAQTDNGNLYLYSRSALQCVVSKVAFIKE